MQYLLSSYFLAILRKKICYKACGSAKRILCHFNMLILNDIKSRTVKDESDPCSAGGVFQADDVVVCFKHPFAVVLFAKAATQGL